MLVISTRSDSEGQISPQASVAVQAVPRSKRKPPPISSIELEETLINYRYPRFDPKDPFAPLADLRRRSLSSANLYSGPGNKDFLAKLPLSKSSYLQHYQTSSNVSRNQNEISCIDFPAFYPTDFEAVSLDNTGHQRYDATRISGSNQLDYHYQPWMKRHCSASSLHQIGIAEVEVPLLPPPYTYRTSSQRLSGLYSESLPTSNFVLTSGFIVSASDSKMLSTKAVEPSSPSRPQSPFAHIMSRARSSSALGKYNNRHESELVKFPSDISRNTPRPTSPKVPSKLSQSVFIAEKFGTPPRQELELFSNGSMETELGSYVSDPKFVGGDFEAQDRRRSRTFSLTPRSIRRRVDEVTISKNSEPPSYSTPFDEAPLPSQQQLMAAASLDVIAESGVRIPFGNLWQDKRSIIVFVQKFGTETCRDYLRTISTEKNMNALKRARIKLNIIAYESPALLSRYRRLAQESVVIYTDPTLSIHRALGIISNARESANKSDISSSAISKFVVRIMQTKRFLVERGGYESTQLGGEFVLGPGLTCSYSHRMANKNEYTPFEKIITAAGVDAETSTQYSLPSSSESSSTIEDEEAWMERRRLSWFRLQEKRRRRRGGEQFWHETGPPEERRLTILETTED